MLMLKLWSFVERRTKVDFFTHQVNRKVRQASWHNDAVYRVIQSISCALCARVHQSVLVLVCV